MDWLASACFAVTSVSTFDKMTQRDAYPHSHLAHAYNHPDTPEGAMQPHRATLYFLYGQYSCMLRAFVYTCTQAIILAFFKSDHHFEKGGKSGLLAEEEERKGEMREETMEMKVGMGETMRGGDVVCVGESCPLTAHPFLR